MYSGNQQEIPKGSPIPHDIISFWNETSKMVIACPDESQYDLWCYWMLRNGHPVHEIKTDKGHCFKVGDRLPFGKITALKWRSNYWGAHNEQGEILWIQDTWEELPTYLIKTPEN